MRSTHEQELACQLASAQHQPAAKAASLTPWNMSLWKKPPSRKDGMVAVIDAAAIVLCLSAGSGPQPGTARPASWKETCLLHLRGPLEPAAALLGMVWLLDRIAV